MRELSILLTDDQGITALNREYRHRDEPTDVLSFSAADSPEDPVLGDVVISLERVERQAEDFSVPFEEEIRRVTVHAILHLLGMEHDSTDLASEPMLQRQEQILTTLGGRLF